LHPGGLTRSSQEGLGLTDDQRRDGARVRFPPPLVFLAVIGVGAGLDHFGLPWRFDSAIARVPGGLLLAAGLGSMAAALGLFLRTGQNPEPWTATPSIITSGIFRFTRNPMYLGMALTQAGVGLLLGFVWIVALTPLAMALVYGIAIRHEERYLAEKFGAEYIAYCRAVRRWL
jgi:protein-S-isoprenylcysteine O-methyltransferase Ste14